MNVPEGWKHTTFEKHIELLSGFPFKSSGYTSDDADIRLLRGDNIEPGGIRWRNAKKWPIADYESLKKFHLQTGDFVIAMDRTWISSGLKVAEIKEKDLPTLLVQRVSRIRARDTLEQGLLRQYFSGYRFEQYVKSVQTETAVPHISANQIKEFPLLLPPLPEQKKIARILSTWDRAIEVTEKLLNNSQQQKKALMQQLLTGKKRLPGFSGEWKTKALSDLSNLYQPTTISAKEFTETGYPVYGANGIIGFYNKTNHDTWQTTVTCRGSTCGTVNRTIDNCWITGNAMVLNCDENKFVDKLYFYYVLSAQNLSSCISGTGQPQIVRAPLASFKVLISDDLKEQQKIASVLSAADKQIEILEQKLDCLRQEKKALMQQLLTGKRRVKVDEAEVSEKEAARA